VRGREPGGPEERVDLSGLSRLSDRPPRPRAEATARVVRALTILLLAVAAAGLPWYVVTRGAREPAARPSRPTASPASPSPSPPPSPTSRLYEVAGVQRCLNVRAEPSTSARRLDCLIPGVRVESDGQTAQAEGRTWRRIYDPIVKMWGWAADEYLRPL
jgi:hypothetical protein